jgi:malate dehydrogenase
MQRAARPKVTIAGAGMVGGTAAQLLAQRDYADIVLIDVVDGLPQGKALDLAQAGPVLGFDSRLSGATTYESTAGSDVVVITSGVARKPGMTRDDLLRTNMGIVASVTRSLVEASPDAIIVVVSNPLDAMCHVALDESGFPRARVVGQAGVLDAARFRTSIAQELDVSVKDVTAFVLGGHGDTMVPLSRCSTVAGIPIAELLPPERIAAIEARTAAAGAWNALPVLSRPTISAPAASVVEMIDAILLNQKRILPCSVHLHGEYGVDGLFVGVPVKLGRNGVEQVIEIRLTDSESAAFRRSADAVRELVEAMRRLGG